MPYATNQGVQIHYEIEGDGPPLILMHGFLARLGRWRQVGYVAALKDSYQLILLDCRGHGASDKPHEQAAYLPHVLAGDVLAVMDALGLDSAHYWGYSMGASLGRAVADLAPNRLRSLIMGGAAPHPVSDKPNPWIAPLSQGMDGLIQYMDKEFPGMPADMRAGWVANDVAALLACQLGLSGAKLIAPLTNVPCLLYSGDKDESYLPVQTYAAQLPNATFFSLPGLSHGPAFLRTDLVLPHVTAFLARVSQ